MLRLKLWSVRGESHLITSIYGRLADYYLHVFSLIHPLPSDEFSLDEFSLDFILLSLHMV